MPFLVSEWQDPTLKIAVLEGSDHTFCAGADLASMDNPMISIDSKEREDELRNNALIAPMGCTRMALSKPVICAVEGFCVAGGEQKEREKTNFKDFLQVLNLLAGAT